MIGIDYLHIFCMEGLAYKTDPLPQWFQLLPNAKVHPGEFCNKEEILKRESQWRNIEKRIRETT